MADKIKFLKEINFNNKKASGLPSPVDASDAATKEYVDNCSISIYEEIKTEEFVSLVNSNNLHPAKLYRIIDYKPTWYGENFIMAGNQFDILIQATSKNTYSKQIRFINHEGDTYFANCDLTKWQGILNTIDTSAYNEYFLTYKPASTLYGAYLYYDNRTIIISNEKYYIYKRNGDNEYIPNPLYSKDATLTSSSLLYYSNNEKPSLITELQQLNYNSLTVKSVKRGIVIDRLIDEFNNDCPYDFKNVVYLGAGNVPAGSGNTGPVGYTFSNTTTFFNWSDDTVNPYDVNCRTSYNKVIWKKSTMNLPANLFGHGTIHNQIELGSYNNFIGDYCKYNKIGNNTYNVILPYECNYNKIGNNCVSVSLGNKSNYNIIGDDCSTIVGIAGPAGFKYNKIENNCHYITLKNTSNIHGLISYINIGAGSSSITYENSVFGGILNWNISSGVNNLTIQTPQDTSVPYQNIRFCSGINNKTIIVSRESLNSNFEIVYHAKNSQDIVVD